MRKPCIGRDVVRERLRAVFPNVSGLEPIRGGEESQVFRFDSEGQGFILRLNATAEGFEKDRFVHERFARQELRIPEVVQIGEFDDHFYCVSQRVPGRTLEDLPPEEVSELLGPTCDVLHAISECDVGDISGWGPFNSSGTGAFSTWRSFLMAIADTANEHGQCVREYTNAGTIKGWLERFEGLAAGCPEERALVHGDFGSNNVLADGQRITGVVDWSEAMIGDPLFDVANIFFWRTWLSCMEQQAQYFEAHPPSVPDWAERILCYQLRIGLSEVFGNAAAQREKELIWALRRCDEIVRVIDCGRRA